MTNQNPPDVLKERGAVSEASSHGWHGRMHWVVCFTTVLFNTAFGVLAIVTLCGIVFITRPNQVMHGLPPWAWLPLLVVMAPAQIYAQLLAWRTIAVGQTASGPAIASRQVCFPRLLRPFVAIMWLINFVIGFGIVVSLSKPQPGRPLEIGGILLIGILTFWLTFAANVYLLLAARTLTRDVEVLKRIWRHRVMVDFAIAIVAIVIYHL